MKKAVAKTMLKKAAGKAVVKAVKKAAIKTVAKNVMGKAAIGAAVKKQVANMSPKGKY